MWRSKNVFLCVNEDEFWVLDIYLDPDATYARKFVQKEVFND